MQGRRVKEHERRAQDGGEEVAVEGARGAQRGEDDGERRPCDPRGAAVPARWRK